MKEKRNSPTKAILRNAGAGWQGKCAEIGLMSKAEGQRTVRFTVSAGLWFRRLARPAQPSADRPSVWTRAR